MNKDLWVKIRKLRAKIVDLDEAKAKVNHLITRNRNMDREIVLLRLEIEEHQDVIKDQQARVETLMADATNLRRALKIADGDIVRYRDTIRLLNSKITHQAKKIRGLLAEVRDLLAEAREKDFRTRKVRPKQPRFVRRVIVARNFEQYRDYCRGEGLNLNLHLFIDSLDGQNARMRLMGLEVDPRNVVQLAKPSSAVFEEIQRGIKHYD